MKRGIRLWKREKPEKILVKKKGRSKGYEVKEPGPGFDEFFRTLE